VLVSQLSQKYSSLIGEKKKNLVGLNKHIFLVGKKCTENEFIIEKIL